MFEELKTRLEGCFYTIFAPFDENLKIDYLSLEKYLHFLYSKGASSFYAMAYNSRYSQMKHSEIKAFNEFCIKTVKNLDHKNIIIVGDPIHCSTDESLEFTVHAKENGADLISLIVREKYFSDEQILEHFQYIGEKSKFPILVHEMPFLSGYNGQQMHWPDSLLQSLKKNPYIVALKEDAKNFEITSQALKLEPDIRIVIAGTKQSFMNYKELGALAYLNGISIIDPRIGELFWESYKNSDQNTIDIILDEWEGPFFNEAVSKYGWHRCNKALLQAAGLMHRRERMPLKELSETEFEDIKRVYSKISSSIESYFSQ